MSAGLSAATMAVLEFPPVGRHRVVPGEGQPRAGSVPVPDPGAAEGLSRDRRASRQRARPPALPGRLTPSPSSRCSPRTGPLRQAGPPRRRGGSRAGSGLLPGSSPFSSTQVSLFAPYLRVSRDPVRGRPDPPGKRRPLGRPCWGPGGRPPSGPRLSGRAVPSCDIRVLPRAQLPRGAPQRRPGRSRGAGSAAPSAASRGAFQAPPRGRRRPQASPRFSRSSQVSTESR